ncbi:hypothetical protein ACFQZR_24830 [Paenibacillus sp. GCM10027629]|uniref:hypothetical protein n=1 Tax=Paenibacillus sp. GCM10027629 TaxID=3273414 RepID=UPI00362D8ED8
MIKLGRWGRVLFVPHTKSSIAMEYNAWSFVQTGQLLRYMRMLQLDRPDIWD